MQINGNKSVPQTGGTFTGALGILGTPSIDIGGGWLSGTSVYGDSGTGAQVTLFDSRAMAIGVGPEIDFAAKVNAGGTYKYLAGISAIKSNANADDDTSALRLFFNATNGSPVYWVLDGAGLSPSADNTYDLGASAKQVRTVYAGTSVIIGATGTTIGPTGITKYNNINTAGSGTAPIYGSIALSNQAASIGTTNLYAAAPAGLYRICWRQKITTPAGTSSSLLVTIGWNDGAARTTTVWVDTVTGTTGTTADATNTSTGARGNCLTIYSAAGQNITYATTYASNAAGAMKYSLDMTVEKLN